MKRRDFIQMTGGTIVGAAWPGTLQAASSQPPPLVRCWLHLTHVYRHLDARSDREQAIDDLLDRHLAAGLRTVMPYVTNTSGEAVFPNRLIKSQPVDAWDPLEYLISGAKERGLEVHPAFCVLVSGHQEPSGILVDHPEWASRHPNGKPMGHLCPTHPGARNWVTSLIADVVQRYPIQGIMLDYFRYYNRPHRLDAASEKELVEWQKSNSDISETQAFQTYREQAITQLLGQIRKTTREHNRQLKIAIYSWGPHVAKNHQVAQPWPDWSRDGLIDQVSISGYCYPENYGDDYLEVFRRRIGDAVELNRQNKGQAQITFTLGVSTSHGKIRQTSWIDTYLKLAAKEGATGVDLFTWKSLQPHLEETIRRGYLSAFRQQISGG